MLDNVSGKWLGEYIYGSGYEPALTGRRVEFEMILNEEDNYLTGYCIDDETRHLFEKGSSIEGERNGPNLRFYVTYPAVYALNEAGVAYIAGHTAPPSIEYNGQLKTKWFSGKVYVEGDWELHGAYRAADGSAEYYVVKGSWRMERTLV